MVRIERKADYYQMTALGGDDGLFGHKIIEICEKLSPEDRETGYKGTSVLIELLTVEPQNGLIKGIVHQNRNTAPTKRKQGKTETKPVDLDTGEGIDEKTHFIYCPETSLMCIEYNYHGPKIGLLKSVVNQLYKELDKEAPRSSYILVKRGNAYNEVVESTYVKSVTAKLKDPTTLGGLNEDADLPDIYEELKAPETANIEIKISAKERTGYAYRMREFKKLFLRNEDDVDNFDKLEVTVLEDQTGKVTHHDLVKDKLQDEFMANLKDGTSEIDTESMVHTLTERINKVKQEYRF